MSAPVLDSNPVVSKSAPPIRASHRRMGFWLAIAAIAVAGTVPFLISDYDLFNLSRVGAVAIGVASLNLLTGFSGQVSLGQGATFGIGGYAAMMTMRFLEWPVGLALLAAVIVGAVVGLVIGLPAVRMGGFNLGLLTIVIAALFPVLLYRFSDFTGGQAGVTLVAPAFPSPTESLTDAQWQYLVVLGLLVLTIVFLDRLVGRRTARALALIRASRILAAANGVDVERVKLQLFVISSALAAFGGAVFAFVLGLVVPESYPLIFSITLLVASVVGGSRSWIGAVLGAAMVVFLPSFASSVIPGESSAYLAQLAFAVVLGVCVIVAPDGIAGGVRRVNASIRRTLRARRQSRPAIHPTTHREEPR
ncbi:branched-chain amino acid ABC transporter permease [Agromyces sp. MMS24-JH15]|uniref:branched-chain amino acid ABC transporter permease n=1 Tax=Agromyces sp. MMS24-JH15 TaxID=3243765 RepID=UPI0037489341